MDAATLPPLVGVPLTLASDRSSAAANPFATQEDAQTFASLCSMGGSSDGGFGRSNSFGGSGGSDPLVGTLQSLLIMQMLQPLTEVLNKLVERLDALDGGVCGSLGGATVNGVPTQESLPHHNLIERLATTYNVPAAFLSAVMMAERGGDPNAVGDDGAAVGLFQLHERGMGAGLGDLRRDPELNAAIGARGLAEGWHEGIRQGLDGEGLVRFAYDYCFNPGGGDGYQGDAVFSFYRFYHTFAEHGGLLA